MHHVAVSLLGDLVVLHPDDPPEHEVRRRLTLLLQAPLPLGGLIQVLPGNETREVRWRVIPPRPIPRQPVSRRFPCRAGAHVANTGMATRKKVDF